MAVYKDNNGTWYISVRYVNWKGEHARKVKRGFATKREATDWERNFLHENAGNLDMSFETFVDLYKKNLKERLKLSTWQTKVSIIDTKILPYFKKKRINDIKVSDVVAWQNTLLNMEDENGERYSLILPIVMLICSRPRSRPSQTSSIWKGVNTMYRRPNLSKTSQPPRKKKNVEPTSQNPRALRDERNRVRYITVGFRVSPEQNEKINAAVAISGLSKQEYCYRRCLCQDVVVQGNPRVFKGLKDQLDRVLSELERLNTADEICPETLETIQLIAVVLNEMK